MRDRWCCDLALKDSFPSLFNFAENKRALVAKVWEGSTDKGMGHGRDCKGLEPLFFRDYNDWELDFLEEIYCFFLYFLEERK